jgi:hypothetical protein
MADVTAATEHQTYQGTEAVREVNGMEAETVVALKQPIIDRQTGRLVFLGCGGLGSIPARARA